MIEIFWAGTGLIALLMSWRCVLRPTLRDYFKDKMFDIRDSVRDEFASKGLLNSVQYHRLRDAINRQILFVEEASFLKVFFFGYFMRRNPHLADAYSKMVDNFLRIEDPEASEVVHQARAKARDVIHIYVFHSSFYGVLFVYAMLWPLALIGLLVQLMFRQIKVVDFRSAVSGLVRRSEKWAIRPRITEAMSQRYALC